MTYIPTECYNFGEPVNLNTAGLFQTSTSNNSKPQRRLPFCKICSAILKIHMERERGKTQFKDTRSKIK